MKIKTNNQPRDILSWYDLTPEEQKEFDYLEEGVAGWEGYYSGTSCSGVLIRYTSDCDQVIVGQYFY